MSDNKEWVQCFYSLEYNEGYSHGQSKFAWGFGWFHLRGEPLPLVEQLLTYMEKDDTEVFNMKLTAFTPFHNNVFEDKA